MAKLKKLERKFFARNPEVVARDLLGKYLVRKINGRILIGKIVETEAYLGTGDKASHSHKGQTKRNAPMFGPAGYSYVYFTYGIHWLLNFVTEFSDKPSAVLIRAIEPLEEYSPGDSRIGSGPAKLTKWLGIDGKLNNIDITVSDELFVTSMVNKSYTIINLSKEDIVVTSRIGVGYAGEHKNLPLRYYLKNSGAISKR